ncbi:MXAN_6640 family putative metalloprotease [Nocardioides marmotae]|uniref:MXAN_6640 family putative metalloprotease n=1 Tax=Nocardioides marmotae TaxID=2663857 RepID=UPI0012B624A4|nr:MXAN_6640 family putative metalloprotease [Nocardioides marmotae]MBC9735248.1 hypothetical protein [Nocardioides marmotae]MTB86348.1 hypothetical protein [Nocardioides marmotae]
MLPRPTARLAALLVLLVGLAGVGVLPAGADGERPSTGPTREVQAARAALASAQDALAGDGREVTLALRDLALTRSALEGEQREAADRILARPTDGPLDPDGYGLFSDPQRRCTQVCVHWVESGRHAVPSADADADGIPDYVERALKILTQVHRTYVRAGYRAPHGDGTLGGDKRPDVYLADIGSQAIYGYCTSDQQVPSGGPFDVWAYCVLDNDYDPAQFPQNNPLDNLRVTAAHEYFHAVQYAYDAAEDAWLLEATATWAEDELFTDVDDNVQYLAQSPLAQPRVSLDDSGGLQMYGGWIFFRHLTERFPRAKAGLPTFVRDVWRQADGRRGAADRWSVQAVDRVLRKRGTSLRAAFARFAAENRRARTTYDEGRANRYPNAPLADQTVLRAGASTGWGSLRLDHLAAATIRLRPAAGVPRGTRLRLQLDLPATVEGGTAVVTTKPRRGPVATRLVRTGRDGEATVRVPFGSVSWVEVTLANTSSRYRCWQATAFACMGLPLDDRREFRVKATAVR